MTEADVENCAVNNDLSVSDLIRPYDISKAVPENVLALNDVEDYEIVDRWAQKIAGKLTTTGENVRKKHSFEVFVLV